MKKLACPRQENSILILWANSFLKRGSKFGPWAAQTHSKNARVRPGLLDIPIERPVRMKTS